MTVSPDDTRLVANPSVPAEGTGLLLAGDIGGTKTAVAVFSAEHGPRLPLFEGEFLSARYASLAELVRDFLAGLDLRVERACFAVAGPVIAGKAKVTNLPWLLSEAELAAELGVRSAHLVNDLEAIALAMSVVRPSDLYPLNTGESLAGGALAVIAPGTGLGEAFLVWDGTRYRAFPSEGGHADFAPTTELQAGLLVHLLRRFGHVSVERVCSGPGLFNIYDYLRVSGHAPESAELARLLAGAEDGPRLIGEAALRRPDPDPLSRAAMELFVSILGAEAGNLALKVLGTGGVYLAGGIPKRILPALCDGRFMQAFVAKGRLADLLARVPVQVVTLPAALLGAALSGLESSREPAPSHGARGGASPRGNPVVDAPGLPRRIRASQ